MVENIQRKEQLDPLTCELAVWIHEYLRFTNFISTKELSKLKTCHNLDTLQKYFELERQILEIIFWENPKLKTKKSFIKDIELDMKNFDMISLIEEYVSIDYIRRQANGFEEENVKKIRLFISKDEKGRFYIWNIKILSN